MKKDLFLQSTGLPSKGSVAMISLLISSVAFAQDEATGDTKKSLLDTYVIDGGTTMFLILVVILALVALVVFNFMNISRSKFAPIDLKNELLDHMANCRVRSAIEVASASPSYLGRMLAYALPNVDASKPENLGRDKVEDAIADFSINENRKNMVWINYISLVAQAAPMVGLFGTVLGMVAAFATLSADGADPSKLANNISTALLTTLWGLVIAIPALIFYYFFKNKMNSYVAECHQTSEELINASLQTIHRDAYLAKIPEGLSA